MSAAIGANLSGAFVPKEENSMITPEQIRDAIIATCDEFPDAFGPYETDGSDLLIVNGLLNLSIVAKKLNEATAEQAQASEDASTRS
jgi:hypothetical protein